MKPATTGRQASRAGLWLLRHSIAFPLVYEVVLVLLGGAVLLIGNGLLFAVMLLVAVLLMRRARRTEGQSFEGLSFSFFIRYIALVSFLVGAGIWLLVEVGFEGQNFIWMALS